MEYGKTEIVLCQSNEDLGARAANDVARCVMNLLADRDELRLVFAAGESQTTFLEALARHDEVDWQRIVCFNVDDFWDTRMARQYSCGYQTQSLFYDKVKPKAFHLVDFAAPDAQAEADRFEALLRQAGGLDVLCQGIGTSGHLALNEPGQTEFNDPRWVRVVRLAEQSKRQLIDDPNFKALGYIPEAGITMTIPALLVAAHTFTMVPLALKRSILARMMAVQSPDADLPASILSTVSGRLYVDRDSCPRQLLN